MNNQRKSQYHASTVPVPPTTPSSHNNNSTPPPLTGYLPWCHRCNNVFPKDAAKFCLCCGEARLERCHVGDAFHKIVGNRAFLRKMDLRKFQRYMGDLLETLARENAKSFRCISSCVQDAFNAVMDQQQKDGVKASQGISIDYFENFLARVARSLDLTMPSLLFGLLEQPEVSWNTMDFGGQAHDHQSTPSSRRTSTIEVMETPSTARSSKISFVDGCTKCGSKFISNAKFCCECGEKQPEPKKFDKGGFHFFKGTELSIASGQQPEVQINQKDFEEVVELAKRHQMRIEEVRSVQREFHDLDKNHNGSLSLDEFTDAVRRYCSIKDGATVPTHLLDQAWFKVAGDDASGGVDFDRFLTWRNRVSSTEEMLVSDPQERFLRQLAREHGLAMTDVDDMKKLFDRFDSDKNGYICENEFRTMMAILMQGTSPEDLPEQTVHRMWGEIDDRQTGIITFERFLLWSSGNFTH